MLFGTDFQKKVWRKLFELREEPSVPRLISYSDFADLCQNRTGVRAVAHAIGLNPVSVIIPCHLVIPKESIDKIKAIRKRAESTIFKGDDLCMDSILRDKGFDFGEYALGKKLKRLLIQMEFQSSPRAGG
jgi:O-6-methylguanine DNA methyltransferase